MLKCSELKLVLLSYVSKSASENRFSALVNGHSFFITLQNLTTKRSNCMIFSIFKENSFNEKIYVTSIIHFFSNSLRIWSQNKTKIWGIIKKYLSVCRGIVGIDYYESIFDIWHIISLFLHIMQSLVCISTNRFHTIFDYPLVTTVGKIGILVATNYQSQVPLK